MPRSLILLSASLLAPLFAQKSSLPVRYEIGPCFAGEVGHIYLDVDTVQYPRFYSFLRVQNGTRYDYYDQTYHRGSGERDIIDIPIPTTLTNRGTFTVEFGFQSNSFQSSKPSTYVINFQETITAGQRYQNLVIDHDQILDPERARIVLDETSPYHSYTLHDSYTFQGVSASSSNQHRLIPVSAMRITYSNERFEKGNLAGIGAELRVLDYPDDFSGIGEKIGDAYRSIPLTPVVHASNGYQTTMSFKLASLYSYSRIDYRVGGRGPQFISDQLYAPLRMGHDGATYRYQIVLTNASEAKDSFFISSAVSFARRVFGPCAQSEYCLMIGGKTS